MKKKFSNLALIILLKILTLLIGDAPIVVASEQQILVNDSKPLLEVNCHNNLVMMHDAENNNGTNSQGTKDEIFFEQLRAELQKSVYERSGQIGISFFCLTTGKHFSINGDQLFFGASTAKFPNSLMIADMVDEGILDWDHQVVYEAKHYEGGTGILQNHIQIGDAYPLDELMKLSLVHSDNIAHLMLSSAFATVHENRAQYITERYLPGADTDGTFYYSPNQMMKLLLALYIGKEENSGYAKIYEHMSSSMFHSFLNTPSTRNHIAHKIGLCCGNYHDIGIFSAKHPYILVVMTYQTPDAINYISRVSDLVWSLNLSLR